MPRVFLWSICSSLEDAEKMDPAHFDIKELSNVLVSFLFLLCRSFDGYLELSGWDLYNFPKEMDRQGVSLSNENWNTSSIPSLLPPPPSPLPRLMCLAVGS